jgi:hypothetical protein
MCYCFQIQLSCQKNLTLLGLDLASDVLKEPNLDYLSGYVDSPDVAADKDN